MNLWSPSINLNANAETITLAPNLTREITSALLYHYTQPYMHAQHKTTRAFRRAVTRVATHSEAITALKVIGFLRG